MKKNTFTLILFMVLGLLAGSIASRLLEPVKALEFLVRSTSFTLEPKADWQFVEYDVYIQVKLNLMNLLGAAGSVWIYRKL